MGVPMIVGFVQHIMGDGQAIAVRPAAFDVLEEWFGPGPELVARYDAALEGDWRIAGRELVGEGEMAHFLNDWRAQGDIVMGFLYALHDARAHGVPIKVRERLADDFAVSYVTDADACTVTVYAPSIYRQLNPATGEWDDVPADTAFKPDPSYPGGVVPM